jgi:polar amino acid transport system substrate-binding protein
MHKLTRQSMFSGIVTFIGGVLVAVFGAVVPPATAQTEAPKAPPKIEVPASILVAPGKLIMSTNPQQPPAMYYDEKRELKGYNIELGKEVAKRLGLTPEYMTMEFAAQIPGVQARRFDMVNTGIYITAARQKVLNMIPYTRQGEGIVVAKGNPKNIKGLEDLCGMRVAVEHGGTTEANLREIDTKCKSSGKIAVTMMVFNDIAITFQTLEVGQADAVYGDDPAINFHSMTRPGAFTKVLSAYKGKFVSLATTKENVVLAEAVVKALLQMKEDGWYDKFTKDNGLFPIDKFEINPALDY